jgi:TorA maturation chaperone TorD
VSGSQPLHFSETLPAEEVARANFYGLLARLFYAPPDAPLLHAIAGSGQIEAEAGGIAAAWQALARAAGTADAEAVREEYEASFIGTGKAPVTLYTTAYTIRYSSESPLAELRGDLARLGLARRSDAFEPEDHIAGLCDAMRHLIAEQKRDLSEQSHFFGRWLAPAGDALCDAISAYPGAPFSRHVANFAKSFFHLEHSSFEML